MSKITKQEAIELAAHLVELELDSISNDAQEHFSWNGWLEKFGENSHLLVDQVTAAPKNEFNSKAIELISEFLVIDFESGQWERTEEGLYDYMMPTMYGDIIVDSFEKQLATITGVGIQLEIF